MTCLDREGQQVSSRLGVSAPAIYVSPELNIHELALKQWPLHYLVCDEVQFYTVEQIDQLARIADEMEVDVYVFGLITDFRGLLFDGTKRMQKSPMNGCLCRKRAAGVEVATHNARVVNDFIVYEGETVVVGDTVAPGEQKMFGDVVRYELLCRHHFIAGDLGM